MATGAKLTQLKKRRGRKVARGHKLKAAKARAAKG